MHWLLLSLAGIDTLCLAGLLGVPPQLNTLFNAPVWLAAHLLVVLAGSLFLAKKTQVSALVYTLWLVLLTFLPVIGFVLGWVFLRKETWYRPPVVKALSPQEAAGYFDITTEAQSPYEFAQASQRMNALTTDDYLDLLSATRQLDGRNSVTLLKDALDSQTESARLLAHALYTKKEQQLAQQLSALIEQFKQGQGRNPQLHLAFAQLYWHWFGLGVLGEEGCRDMLAKIRLHADFVLKLIPNLAQAHWLVAQTDLHSQRYQSAKHAFQQALAQGCRAELVLPYLQEIAFRQNRPNAHEHFNKELS